jgi:hypothetical protein
MTKKQLLKRLQSLESSLGLSYCPDAYGIDDGNHLKVEYGNMYLIDKKLEELTKKK